MGINIVTDYVAPVKVNPYVADLAGLEIGTVFSVNVTPTISEKTGKVRGIEGENQKVQEGARANGMTARTLERRENGDGTLTIVYQLSGKQKGGRGRKSAKSAK